MEDKKIISVSDSYSDCLEDCIGPASKRRNKRGPQGFVEIYDVDKNGEKKLIEKSNLVVYTGREWVAQRIFNVDNILVTSDATSYIAWFALGSGASGPILNPTGPNSTDSDLTTILPMHDTDTNNAGWNYSTPNGYYYFHPLDTVQFVQDPLNANRYLIAQAQITVGTSDCNGPSGESQLNEAGLYIASSNVGGHTGPFTLFSRVTFATLIKNNTRQIVFLWGVYV